MKRLNCKEANSLQFFYQQFTLLTSSSLIGVLLSKR